MERLAPKNGTPSDFTSQISMSKLWNHPFTPGSFSVVYQYTINTSEGTKEVAVKVLNVNLGRAAEKYEKAMRRELEVWLKLSNHRTIVPLLGTADVGFSLPALVSQWMPSGTLYMYLEQGMVTTSAKVELVMGVANGLNHLHSEDVVHGDLHPANVLIDELGNPRLTDFGLATVVGDAELQLNTTTAGRSLNPQWRAPEVIGIHSDDEDPVRPNFKSDVYSFGGVMFFIISGHTPWKEKKTPHQIIAELLKRATPARHDNIPDNYWNLIQLCWSWEPSHRPEVAKVIGSLATKTTAILVKTESTIRTTMSHSTTQTIHPEAAARTRFDHRGNAEDLDQAIAFAREALALRPVGHTDRSVSLNNLANLLSTRFDHRGNAEALDQAIALYREALALYPVGHPNRSMSLNNLANQLSTRFYHRGNAEDLDQAIALDREALALRPVGHTDRSVSLNNLANRLSTCFDHRGNAEDLDQAIAFAREAVALCPVGHTDRSMSLNNLSNRLSTRFDHRGNAEDLDQAIAIQKEVLALLPIGHTDRSSSLNILAIQLSKRFGHRTRGNAKDLD